LPQADARLRQELDDRAAAVGWPALHAELARVDPATAARLKTTDSQRIQRALEVYRISGTPLSALQGARESDGAPDLVAIALIPSDRAELHRRIAGRFDAMLAAGGSLARAEGLGADHEGVHGRFHLARRAAGVDVVAEGHRQGLDLGGRAVRGVPAGGPQWRRRSAPRVRRSSSWTSRCP